jgi:hypothetical protein
VKKVLRDFFQAENLRFSRVLCTRHDIPDVRQAVYPQPVNAESRRLPVVGVDFTSAPSRRKPITVARGTLVASGTGGRYRVDEILELSDFDGFSAFLRDGGPWIGGFDLPFGQPRELVEHEGWPTDWPSLVRHYCGLSRGHLRERFRRFCDARPPGGKFAWRKADRPAGSSPAMRWAQPPVAWMMHAGILRLLEAGLVFPAHRHPCEAACAEPPATSAALADRRIALEAYPGYSARMVARTPYKRDESAARAASRDPVEMARRRGRREARAAILAAVESGGAGLGIVLEVPGRLRDRILADPGGDLLDAAICGLQACRAALSPGWGLPESLDPLEGWIAAVPAAGPAGRQGHPADARG